VSKQLKQLLQSFIPQEHTWKTTILREWDNIIGHLKKHVIIDKIDKNCLYLGVTHPTWAQELHLLSHMLKKKINAHCDQDRIRHIRFKVIIPNQHATFKKNKKISRYKAEDISMTPITSQEASKLGTIKDKELQQSLKHFLQRCKQPKRST